MNEIVAITECIDSFCVSGIRFSTCPIHSDIPFEEQMEAFNEPDDDEVKVIIATNAAESSVTLPTVDHVICMGLCRQVIYNPTSHRQMLAPMWISQASAKQRAGRTGRVRPGNVYRLYTREAFQQYMDEFDPGEISRTPLDSVILMLKEMLHEEVIPVLNDCIEPPSMETIDRSFESLYRSNFIQEPNDEADITSLGSFVSSLGIDLTLGSLIGLGIQFGVAAEAIEMAAMMSFPKTPFQITNPLFHDPATFNEITSHGYISRCHFDANLFSEPMSLMNAVHDYNVAIDKSKWCLRYRIAIARMKQLASTRKSLRARVARYFRIDEDKLEPESPPVLMHHAKVNLLRILQVWVFSDTIVESWPRKSLQLGDDNSMTLSVRKDETKSLQKCHLEQVLDTKRHPYDIIHFVDLRQTGSFDCEAAFHLQDFMPDFQNKLVSYMIEMNIDLVCCFSEESLYLFKSNDRKYDDILNAVLANPEQDVNQEDLLAEHDRMMKRQGYLERKCGTWNVQMGGTTTKTSTREGVEQKAYKRLHIEQPSASFAKLVLGAMENNMKRGRIGSFLHWNFQPTKRKKKKKKQSTSQGEQCFELIGRGACQAISDRDLKDLFGSTSVSSVPNAQSTTKICFPEQENQPYPYEGRGQDLFVTPRVTADSSWKRPLLNDIPEGARLLAVLVSGQRRGLKRLRFSKTKSDSADEEEVADNEDTDDFQLDYAQTDITNRWERLGMSSPVLVQENTVSASATNTSGPLYACCSNALEIRGGMLKVESMTLLPSNPAFLLLSMLTFGLTPSNTTSSSLGPKKRSDVKTEDAIEKEASAGLRWLQEQKQKLLDRKVQNVDLDFENDHTMEQIKRAIAFHGACEQLGESLLCYPEMISELCKIFSGVDGHEMTVWESIGETAFTEENLLKWRDDAKRRTEERKQARTPDSKAKTSSSSQDDTPSKSATGNKGRRRKPQRIPTPKVLNERDFEEIAAAKQQENQKSSQTQGRPEGQHTNKVVPKKKKSPTSSPAAASKTKNESNSTTAKSEHKIPGREKENTTTKEDRTGEFVLLNDFHPKLLDDANRWFDTTEEALGADAFIASNILALLHKTFAEEYGHDKETGSISLSSNSDWEIYSYQSAKGNVFYHARFVKKAIPIVSLNGRGKNKLPNWMKRHMRPQLVSDERNCLLPKGTNPKKRGPRKGGIPLGNKQTDVVLVYKSIEWAVKMEAAFWLERQFCVCNNKTGTRHWYQHDLSEMMTALRNYKEKASK